MARTAEGDTTLSRRHRSVLISTLALAVLFFGGTQVVNAAMPGEKPVAVGTDIDIDESATYRTSVRLAEDGWFRDLRARTAVEGRTFTRGPIKLQAVSVNMPGDQEAETNALWAGFGDVLRTRDRGIQLSEPAPVISEQGVEGLTGTASSDGREYVVALYPSPSQTSAAQLVVSAEEGTAGFQEEANALVRQAVIFTETGDAND